MGEAVWEPCNCLTEEPSPLGCNAAFVFYPGFKVLEYAAVLGSSLPTVTQLRYSATRRAIACCFLGAKEPQVFLPQKHQDIYDPFNSPAKIGHHPASKPCHVLRKCLVGFRCCCLAALP